MGRQTMARWDRLAAHWIRMALGRSYYHVPQGLGKAFAPDRLEGYFNDLTAKTAWPGPVDKSGIPLNVTDARKKVYFATTIIQKALGHWDMWIISKHSAEKELFLKLCDWLVENQDMRGGWPLWPQLGFDFPSPYSAMSQGEAISALVRAWSITQERNYLKAANRALDILAHDISKKGTRRHVPEGSILEEVPSSRLSGVLNGWIFALFGVYDYFLAQKDPRARDLLEETIGALVAYLPQYNTGCWSYYDLTGTLASPFYHRLHIAQLEALELAFPEHAKIFRQTREVWARQLNAPLCKARAIAVKAFQKLRNPPEAMLK